MLIASSGQASTQTPQSIQASSSTTALSSTILIASLGHSDAQVSQPVHFSSSTFAGIYLTLSKKTEILTAFMKPFSSIKNGILQDYHDITTYFSKKFNHPSMGSTRIPPDRFMSQILCPGGPLIIVPAALTGRLPGQVPCHAQLCSDHFVQSRSAPA
jgi:hypothetical protein